ncbi:hypothetical protein ACOSQ3_009415 [Xanthoceras sorbifolium]
MDGGEDGRIRTGTLWTGTAHASTAIVGSGILALPWCVAQLGWVLGPITILAFAIITYYIGILLCDCYRVPDPINGRRNYTYTDAVKSLLGAKSVIISGMMQYSLLWGTMIGFTITTATSVASVKKSTCLHHKGENNSANCRVSGNADMIIYGAMEIVLSQCPNLEKATILSVIATVTSILYAMVAFGLSTAKFFSQPQFRGSLMMSKMVGVGETSSTTNKIWHIFQALGNIAFSYTYSILLMEIQDTLKSPPAENKIMKRVTMYSIGGTGLFYVGLACMGYAAFGNHVPGNILTGFHQPFWLVDIANLAVILHLIGAYQVFAQPVFAIHEKCIASRWPASLFNRNHTIKLPCSLITIDFKLSKLLLRTVFVVLTTTIAMMFPFFNAVLGVLGSISFWPLTIYFPLNMYMAQVKIKRGSPTWILYQILSLVCFVVTLLCLVGSIADILQRFKHAKLFHIEP